MALDPSIITAGMRQPEQIDPMGVLGKVLTLRNAQQQQQIGQIDLQEKQKALMDQQQIADAYKQAFTQDANGVLTIDRNKLTQGLATSGQGDKIPKISASLDAADKATAEAKSARADAETKTLDAAGHLAAGVKELGYSPDAFSTAVHHMAANGLITPQDAQQYLGAAQRDPSVIQKLTDHILAQSPKQTELATAATTASARMIGATKPTEATLAVDAVTPASPTAEQSTAALNKLKPPKESTSLEQQYLTAKTNGDDAVASRILSTIKDTAAAKKDPAMAAVAGELAGLRSEEAKARLQKLQDENAPIDIAQNVNTTTSGRKYVDLGDFQTPEAKEKARKAAEAAGVRPVNKDAAESLRAADNARTNLTALFTQIEPFLAKDPAGRLLKGPGNTLGKAFQSNPTLGAYGSWRTAAIQAVQALAEKGMGLRLNRAEIDLMLQNDIPQITDDGPTAKQRIDNLFTLLDNKEKGLLIRDRSAVEGAPKNPFRK